VTESNLSGSNISGSVVMPEPISKKPIKVSSTAGGQITEIRNNEVLVLKNKDVGIKIDGFIEGVKRGDKINLVILRPDDSVSTIEAYVNRDDSYSILTKLHTKWANGFYELLIRYDEKEQGKIKFYVADKEIPEGQYPAILSAPEKISTVSQYLNGDMTEEDFTLHLLDIGWSESRINEFIANNKSVHTNPYAFYVLVGLVPLLYILVSVLSKKPQS